MVDLLLKSAPKQICTAKPIKQRKCPKPGRLWTSWIRDPPAIGMNGRGGNELQGHACCSEVHQNTVIELQIITAACYITSVRDFCEIRCLSFISLFFKRFHDKTVKIILPHNLFPADWAVFQQSRKEMSALSSRFYVSQVKVVSHWTVMNSDWIINIHLTLAGSLCWHSVTLLRLNRLNVGVK